MATDPPNGPVCTTQRLTIRRVRLVDAPMICAYRSDPEVARYQSWDSFDLARAESLCSDQQRIAFGAPGTWCQLAIERSGEADVIGDIGVHFLGEDPRQIEVGITMAREHQGAGYAAEALGAVLDLAFGSLGMHRASARIDARNTPAARLMSRLGFRHEGRLVQCALFKGSWCDEDVFAILAREWGASPVRGKAGIVDPGS